MSTEPSSFTGRSRDRRTKSSVKFADNTAAVLITIGGIGTILAVLFVGLFLMIVSAPLFSNGDAEEQAQQTLAAAQPTAYLNIDEHRHLVWTVDDQGAVSGFKALTGELLVRKPTMDTAPAVISVPADSTVFMAGFADGSIQEVSVAIKTRFLNKEDMPEAYHDLALAEERSFEEGVVTLTPEGQFRAQNLQVEVSDPIPTGIDQPVVRLDHAKVGDDTVFLAQYADGQMLFGKVERKLSMMTRKMRTKLVKSHIQLDAAIQALGVADYLMIDGLGTAFYLAWRDGTAWRFNAIDFNAVYPAESFDLLDGAGGEVTQLRPLLGRVTLLAGTDTGMINAWFPANTPEALARDRKKMFMGHQLPGPAPVSAIGASLRNRYFVAGYDDGSVQLYHATSNNLVLSETAALDGRVEHVAIAPKDNGIVAQTGNTLHTWFMYAPHADISTAALFTAVHYESTPRADTIWQSTGGSNTEEAKLGLWPLIFGTFKATFYCMLFAIPIALGAAIYTSEFLHKKTKAKIKPIIEFMASLPSVVLGFIAGLWMAPKVEPFVPELMVSMVTFPLGMLMCAYIWQILPQRDQIRLADSRIWFMMTVGMALGLTLTLIAGPLFEQIFFAGDMKRWLDDIEYGHPIGGWVLFILPLTAIGVAIASGRWITPMIGSHFSHLQRQQLAMVDAVKFVLLAIIIFLLAWAISGVFSFAGDTRGSFDNSLVDGSLLGTYVTRNALIVGVAMGFAVIPIIYTIAEDALSAVPEHLRAASLGSGATPWQTATRVIIPTAMSGLFSAIMVGLGRAVGETMIVLMAAGNTPVKDPNIFNGFRTLAANLAVELPEAPQYSTLYRTLFLASVCLFIFTFVLNTFAESIRQRFRKRAFQL